MAREMKWKYEIGDTFSNEKRNITIIDKEIRNVKDKRGNVRKKWYKYRCNICTWDNGWIEEKHISDGTSCSCCSGYTAVKGINTIGDIRPDLILFFKNKDDAFRYTKGSTALVDCICPNCGKEKKLRVHTLYNYGLRCTYCNDGISYPEKFMIAFLDQFNINFIHQLTKKYFEWCGDFRYDFYLPDHNICIETDGIQHTLGSFKKVSRTLNEEKENDRIKNKLAERNGVKCIHIDCYESDPEVIVEGIITSNLCNILNIDINELDVEKCAVYATSSLLKMVCEEYKQTEKSTRELAQQFHISSNTAWAYLKEGTKLGLCYYNPPQKITKPYLIRATTTLGEFVGLFENFEQLIIYIKSKYDIDLSKGGIQNICNGNRNSAKGFMFEYVKIGDEN